MSQRILARIADRFRLALGFRRRVAMEDRLSSEVKFHIDMATEQNRRAGMSDGEARRAALIAFGGRDVWGESARDEFRSRYLDELAQDVRYALRALRKSPGFATAAIATLALSIGATVAMFSVVNAVLLERLPYMQPDKIVVLCEHNLVKASAAACNSLNAGNYMYWQDHARYFEAIGAYIDSPIAFALASAGTPPVPVTVRAATAGVFDVLHPPMLLGRTFTAAEAEPSGPAVLVLTSALWQRHFGADPSVLGRRVTLNAVTYTIIGVTAPGFDIFGPVDLWAPLRFGADDRTGGGRSFHGIARLRPGATLAQANRDMRLLASQREAAVPDVDAHWTAFVQPLRESLVGGAAPALWLLLGAVGFLLLIACANVGNLMLARAAARAREMALRVAIGASRGRLVRQMLTESVVLSFVSAALGLAIALEGTRLLLALVPSGMSVHDLARVAIDWRVLAFTIAVAVLTGVAFGLLPAIQAASGDVHEVLKEGGRGASGSRSSARVRGGLVIAEVSLAVVLLAGAGLMVRSLAALQKVDLGFQPAHVLTAQIHLPVGRYPREHDANRFFSRLETSLGAMPGVESVGSISHLPLTGQRSASGFNVEGQPEAERGAEPIGDMRSVTPGYFSAMGIRLVAGRDLSVADRDSSPSVAVVSQRLAQTFWPGGSASGHYLLYMWGGPQPERVRIVGVAENVRHASVDAEPYMEIYRPLSQAPYTAMNVVIRGAGDPAAYVGPLRDAVKQLDPLLAVGSVRTMSDLVSGSLSKSQLSTALFGTFGIMGLLLAAIGIYGVMSCAVQQRTREMGIRLALGAQRRSVLGLVIGRGMSLTVFGIVLGTVGAFAATRLMRGLLFEVAPADPLTFVLVPVVLAAISLVAAYLPGRRATRLDVVEVLRAE